MPLYRIDSTDSEFWVPNLWLDKYGTWRVVTAPTWAEAAELAAAERREWPELLTAMLFRHRRAGWHREHYDIFSSALLQVTFKRWYAPAVGGDKIALGKAELPRAFCRRQSQSTRSRDSENNLLVHSS